MIDQAFGIAIDAGGNSYVTGNFYGTTTIGPFSLTSAGINDIFVAKYDTSGNVLWARSAGGTLGDDGNAIAVDSAGNSYVTGTFSDSASFGSFTLTGGGGFVAKYDAGGNVLWARVGGPGSGIAVDAGGNSFVTGVFGGTTTFGSFTLTSAGSADIFVAKYDSGGNVLWARSAGGTSSDRRRGIAVDAPGNSYVTGHYEGTATFGPFTLTSASSWDIFVTKYDAGGSVLWASSAGGKQFAEGFGIAIDTAGNSYVTGYYQGAATFGPFTLTSAGAEDIFVAKYNAGGTVLWAQSAGGILSFAFGEDIGVDAAGNSYVAGIYQGTAEFGPFTLTSAGGRDIFVVKYDGCGNVVWVRSAGGTAFDQGNAIAVDDVGTSYVAGRYGGTAAFGSFTLTSAGSSDIFVAKYAATCGNGSIDPDEECDDGGESATCDTDCTVAECGDGTLNVTAGEECDGMGDPACAGACLTDCTCIIAPDPLEACPNPWAPDPEGGKLNRTGCFKMPGSAVAAGEETAIRVKLVDLYIDSIEDPVNGCPVRTEGNDLSAFENQVRYLGPPSALDDNDVLVTPKFIAAELQCTPFYRDWNPAALAADFPGADTSRIYYYGKEVFPCSVHEAQQATQTCVESASESCFSTSLEIRTALWGDVWTPFGGPGQPTFTDIGKVVDAFKSIPFVEGPPPDGAPRKVRAMLRGNSVPLDSEVSFTDIGRVVDAFKTIAYAEDGPTACP